MMLKPETLAVIEPRLIAASAVVDIWPTEMTDAMIRLNSSTWVLLKVESNVKNNHCGTAQTLTQKLVMHI